MAQANRAFPCHYFVAFNYDGNFGNAQVDANTPVENFDAVMKLRDQIAKLLKLPADRLIIISYQLMSINDDDIPPTKA